MNFSDIIGNEDIKRALRSMVDHDSLPHALIFEESDGLGAIEFVQVFLQYLNCANKKDGKACGNCDNCKKIQKAIHPDIYYVFPVSSGTKVSAKVSDLSSKDYQQYWREFILSSPFFLERQLNEFLGIDKKSAIISSAEADQILNFISLSAMTDAYRCVVIYLPEKLNITAANSLLKSLEEPVSNTLFLMISHKPEEIISTVRSRCLSLHLHELTKAEIAELLSNRFHISQNDLDAILPFTQGSPGMALSLLTADEMDMQFSQYCRDIFMNIKNSSQLELINIAESLAAISSRDRQKAFCSYLSDYIRGLFLLQQDLGVISGIRSDDLDFSKTLASYFKKSYWRPAIEAINSSHYRLERNVNPKIIFLNLINKLLFLSKYNH